MVRLITGEQECNNQSLTQTTGRGQDKSRQCAARSGSCYLLDLSPFLQCFQTPHNVCVGIQAVLDLGFPHIAEVGDG
jgi:hypothetical protein